MMYEENRSIGFKKLCQGWAVVPTKERGVGGVRILGHGDRLRPYCIIGICITRTIYSDLLPGYI